MRAPNPHIPGKPTRKQKKFKLPDSPWTYGGTGFNPDLRPSNSARLRSRTDPQREDKDDDAQPLGVSNVPPYHPSFNTAPGPGAATLGLGSTSSESESESESSGGSSDGFGPPPDASKEVELRLGDEGWEVRPRPFGQSAEEMEGWRNGIGQRLASPDRYQRYIPEGSSAEENEDAMDESEEEGRL